MTRPIIILHGWSDRGESFRPLADWLKGKGFSVTSIFLADYLSMNDEVTLFDLGDAFRRALEKESIPAGPGSFDLVVHSTGGLVAREYLRQVCRDPATGKRDVRRAPVRHLCMLAPANFGSPLATLGKSMLGRLLKGWKWDGFGETGQRVLDALELASPYSFELAEDDLFDPEFPILAPENVLTTVLVGTLAYPDNLRSMMHENGSDGTVRVATANLEASYFLVDFAEAQGIPDFVEVPRTTSRVALAVFHRNHASITDPAETTQRADWERTVLDALQSETADYAAHLVRCEAITDKTFKQGAAGRQPEWYKRYLHVALRVRDQHGHPVDDYMVEFYQESRDEADRVFKKINSEILEKVTKNRTAGHYRSFFFDTTDLTKFLTDQPDTVVEMSVSAAHISRRIRFRNPDRGVEVFSLANPAFIRPNQPILVDITLHRDPVVDGTDESAKVFRLAKA